MRVNWAAIMRIFSWLHKQFLFTYLNFFSKKVDSFSSKSLSSWMRKFKFFPKIRSHHKIWYKIIHLFNIHFPYFKHFLNKVDDDFTEINFITFRFTFITESSQLIKLFGKLRKSNRLMIQLLIIFGYFHNFLPVTF